MQLRRKPYLFHTNQLDSQFPLCMQWLDFAAYSHRDTPGFDLAPQDFTKDMTQTDAHTYTSTEAVNEEIDPNSTRTVKVKTDYDYTQNEAYLTTVREEGVVAVREVGVEGSGDGGNPMEGVQVDAPEGGV